MDSPITVSGEISAGPIRVFEAFLDPAGHAAMTGAASTIEADGSFTAWNGYIRGRTIEAESGKKIVQSWRTADFPDAAPDSVLEIEFVATSNGTRVTFRHSDIPDGQGPNYEQGWVDHYLTPMQAWFTGR